MSNHSFYLVDVFPREPLQGNPAALVPDAADLSDEAMRAIAREFNQSETTFLLPPTRPGAHQRLRAFTASGAEVFGAGHYAIGAWWWLAESGRLPPGGGRFLQEIGTHVLPVEIVTEGGEVSRVSMAQAPPRFGKVLTDAAGLAAALAIASDELALDRLPAQVVSTGAAHLMVAVRTDAALGRIHPAAAALVAQLKSVGAEGCYAFSCETRSASPATLRARFFNPAFGIWEDPATATAAGPLACHLVAHGMAKDASEVVVEQGQGLGRLSEIRVRVEGERVTVSGAAVIVGKGELQL